MENTGRARRHLQRARELLGFGSEMSFGENKIPRTGDYVPDGGEKKELFRIMDIPVWIQRKIMHHLDGKSLAYLTQAAKSTQVREYIEKIAEDPKSLINAVENNEDGVVFMLLKVGGVTDELIEFMSGMDPTIRQNEAMNHVRRKLDEISKYDMPRDEYNTDFIHEPVTEYKPVLTISNKGIPTLPIVKIAGGAVTIYGTLVNSRSFLHVGYTVFTVRVIDGCEDLNKRFVDFINGDKQRSNKLTMWHNRLMMDISGLDNARVLEKFRGVSMTLCTPWWIINRARRLRPSE